MIVGTGIDLIEIERIQHSMDRFGSRFLDRIFTPAEKAYCLHRKQWAESFAARFAAKEAGAKALGTGISRGVGWQEIEVVRAPGRRPELRFHGRAAQFAARLAVKHAALSLTHSKSQAMASVILEDAAASAGSVILQASTTQHLPEERRANAQRDSVVTT